MHENTNYVEILKAALDFYKLTYGDSDVKIGSMSKKKRDKIAEVGSRLAKALNIPERAPNKWNV